MKKSLILSLVLLLTQFSYSQMPAYKKNIIAGAVMTGVGGGTLGAGIGLLMIGVNLNDDAFHNSGSYDVLFPGDPWVISGSVLMGIGAGLVIAGPIILSKGIKQKNGTWKGKEKKGKYMSFVPMQNTRFDNYKTTLSKEKIASLTLNF